MLKLNARAVNDFQPRIAPMTCPGLPNADVWNKFMGAAEIVVRDVQHDRRDVVVRLL
jgi:hypothetical protein